MYKSAFTIVLAATTGHAAAVSAQVQVPAESRSDVEVSPSAQGLIDAGAIHTPRAQWSLREAVDGCSVQREFYLEDDHVTFSMKRLQAGYPIEYALIGGDFDPEDGLQAGFVPGTGLADFRRAGSASAGEREGVFFAGPVFTMAPDHYVREESFTPETRYFVAQDRDDQAVVLRTGPIDQALQALEDCGIEQLAQLGVDAAEQNQLRSRATITNSAALAQPISREYGNMMRDVRRTVDGILHIRVVIDDGGELAHCHAGDGLTPRALRDAVCDIIREHGKFRPAVGRDGQPKTDFWSTRIIFQPRPLESWPGADGRNYPARD